MVTIEDVAKKAGVSRMTVSRVINNNGYVGTETRKRVEAAVQEMKYKPNMLAKALATKKQKTLAYVMVNIADPFHNIVKQGFESIAYHQSYTSIMCDVHSAKRQQDYIDSFQENRIGGVAFHHLAITQKQIEELSVLGIECVLMDNEYDIPGVSSISTDNYYGAKIAVEHLLSRGHTRIGCVHGVLEPYGNPSDVPYEDTFQFNIWHQRTNGFIDTMKEHGLEPAGMFACNGRVDIAAKCSDEIVESILASKDISALYCENDIMALAIVKRLQEKGIQIPKRLAVIGHDGLDMVQMLHPVITTIVQPRYQMGTIAAQTLINQIEQHTDPCSIVLKPQLLIGETT